MRQFRLLKLAAVCVFAAFSLSACATSRSVITVAAPTGNQPSSAHVAKITEVRDMRQFLVNPQNPSLPSLASEDEMKDPKITERAVGRKRNTYGMALGDVVIPEGTSVAGLVRAAAQKALQDKGYVVVEESSPDYARAQPLALDVNQFWAWMQPGFTTLTFTFNGAVAMKSETLIGPNSALALSQATSNSAFGTESMWIDVIQKGINDLAEQMKAQIKAPAAAPATSSLEGGTPALGY